MRQHERVTVADKELEERVHAFHQGDVEPKVEHFIYADEVWKRKLLSEEVTR